MSLLEVSGLRVRYGRRHTAVDGVSFTVDAGQTVGVVGESGAGKTTLGRCVSGLAAADAGRIVFDGRDITAAGRRERRALTRSIQYVFQDPYRSLNPCRTIGDTLAEPVLRLPRAEREEKVAGMLDLVGLDRSAASRYPGSFSGGQRQRIAIARALIVSPRLVVCDEPTSALDVSIQAAILRMLRDLQARFGISYLFIAHNLDVVRYMADRTLVMRGGQIVESGPAEQIATSPAHPYTRELVDAMPLADPAAQAQRRRQRKDQFA
jgi:ABC-type oligopeptide transport system ATPase subunit